MKKNIQLRDAEDAELFLIRMPLTRELCFKPKNCIFSTFCAPQR
jgi:hypothetical protein